MGRSDMKKPAEAEDKKAADAQAENELQSNTKQNDESWGHKAIILLRDLICLHELLKAESDKENPSGSNHYEAGDLSKRLFSILDKGHKYVFPDAENKPNSFLKGQESFLKDVKDASLQSPQSPVYKHSLEFVSTVVGGAGATGAEKGKDPKEAGESGKGDAEPETPKAAADEEMKDGITITPLPHDILLLMRGDEARVIIKEGYSGNERLLSLVEQYVSTNSEKDRLSTLSSLKRAQAALAILDLAKESEGFRRGDATSNAQAQFLVAPSPEATEGWREVNRVESAEATLILLFEKFLERERAPWGIQRRSSSGRDGAISPADDFSQPGTVPIATPASHDVLFGRGGLTNNHPGNRRFRDIISLHRPDYVHAIKIEKPNVARRIVKAIRAGSPPGRFLKKNAKDDLWYDVGDRHAAEKTSQALREKVRKNKDQGRSPGDAARKRLLSQNEAMARLAQSIAKRTKANEADGGSGDGTLTSPLALGPLMPMQSVAGMSVPQYGPYSMALRMSDGQSPLTKAPAPQSSGDGEGKGASADGSVAKDGTVGESEKKNGSPDGSAHASFKAASGESKEVHNPVDEHGNIIVTDHDILCGRGGLTNHHRGNKRFRDIVSLHRADYFRAPKVLKPNVARLIVKAIRNGDPPGRFLKKEVNSGLWYDIGDKRAAEKASQALREKPHLDRESKDSNSTTLLAPRPAQSPFLTMNPAPAAVVYPPAGTVAGLATPDKEGDKGKQDDKPVEAAGDKSEGPKAADEEPTTKAEEHKASEMAEV